MDNTNTLTTIDVDGSLASPRLRFSEDGSLLAITMNDNGIKILPNAEGFRLIGMLESRSFEGTKVPPETMATEASPRLRFSEDGSLLAVTMNDNGIKILPNAEGFRLIRMLESRSFEGTKTSIVNAMPPAVTAPGSLRSVVERSDRLPVPLAVL